MRAIRVFVVFLAFWTIVLADKESSNKTVKRSNNGELLMQLVDTAANWNAIAESLAFAGWNYPQTYPCMSEWTRVECDADGNVTSL